MMTGWDEDLLAYELDTLSSEFDMNDFGFTDEMADDGLSSVEEDTVPEVFECRAKRGDVFILGNHRVMCGDSTCTDDVEKLCGGGFADMLLTDPPYNVDVTGRTDKKLKIDNDSFNDESEFLGFLTRAFKASSSAMKDGAVAYIWLASMHLPTFSSAMVDSGITWRQVLVWVKNTFSLGRQDYQWRHELCLYGWKPGAPHYFTNSRSESTVYEYSSKEPDKMAKGELLELVKSMSEGRNATDVLRFDKPSANEDHPTMKPVRLFAYLIRNSSKKGQTVLDPFGGSGTSVIAAEQMGRRCFCMEIDPHYCDVIIERWERMTGLTAVKEGQAS